MKRYFFYLLVSVLAFGIGAFVVFYFYWKAEEKIVVVQKEINQTEIAEQNQANFSTGIQTTYLVAYEGKLVVGKNNSAIIYYGSESGDMAAFCFINESNVGQAILSKCKDKEQCKFSGRITSEGDVCDTAYDYMNRLELGDFSATGKIVSLKSVRKVINKK